jgi:hypothetical protein
MEWIGIVWFVGQGPITAALIIGLFWAALARPDRIRNPTEFRLSALCLGTSVVASVIVPLAVLIYSSGDGRSDRRERFSDLLYLCAIPPSLTMFAILLGIDSVTARRSARTSSSNPTEPR